MLFHTSSLDAKCAGVDQTDLEFKIGFTTYELATLSFLTSMAIILAGTWEVSIQYLWINFPTLSFGFLIYEMETDIYKTVVLMSW